ncbi:MAG: YitT family protein [Oscillospiraceae bacterium]|nr:YitT family protein [Oscillospiraceae bacterium]
MEKYFGEHWLRDTAVELVGSVLTGIAIYNFAVPAAFPMTGFSGLALILYRLFSLPIGVMTIVLNIPVAILCYRLLGRQFFFKSLRCMVLSSLFIDYVAPLLPLYTGGRLLAAICTGVIGGLGYAMIYITNSSTGGSDFIVMAVKAVRPYVQLGKIIFITDAVIIGLGGLIFKDFDGVIYGLIIDYIYAIVTDKLMYGMNAGKLALVVTDYGKAAADKIDELCGRGTTIIEARGGYRGDHRDVVMCACSTKEMLTVERAVRLIDPHAFTVILESNEVLGEGFKSFRVAQKQEDR